MPRQCISHETFHVESKRLKNSVSVLYAWIAHSHIPHAKEAKREIRFIKCFLALVLVMVLWVGYYCPILQMCIMDACMASQRQTWIRAHTGQTAEPTVFAFPILPSLESQSWKAHWRLFCSISISAHTHTHTHTHINTFLKD